MIPDQTTDHNAVMPTDTPERQAFRNAVNLIAIRAQEALPEANGRVFAGVKLVLAGDVHLRPDGTAEVGSQSEGEKVYHVNGHCDCPDAQHRAKDGICKHRIAVAIYRRALAQVAHSPATPAPIPPLVPPPHPLPEAPASANVHVKMGQRMVQLTLRDTSETRLLERLSALLAHFPEESAPATPHQPQDAPEGWCPLHDVQMRRQVNAKGVWWSHKVAGGWCKGR